MFSTWKRKIQWLLAWHCSCLNTSSQFFIITWHHPIYFSEDMLSTFRTRLSSYNKFILVRHWWVIFFRHLGMPVLSIHPSIHPSVLEGLQQVWWDGNDIRKSTVKRFHLFCLFTNCSKIRWCKKKTQPPLCYQSFIYDHHRILWPCNCHLGTSQLACKKYSLQRRQN